MTGGQRSTKRSWPVVLSAVVLVAGAGIGTWMYSHRELPKPPQTTPVAPETPVVTMPVAPDPVPVPVPAPVPDSVAKPLTLRIESVPPGAAIKVDGIARGKTPVDLELDKAADIALELTLAGFVKVEQKLTIDHDQRVLIPLAPKPKVKEPAAPPKNKKKDPFKRFD